MNSAALEWCRIEEQRSRGVGLQIPNCSHSRYTDRHAQRAAYDVSRFTAKGGTRALGRLLLRSTGTGWWPRPAVKELRTMSEEVVKKANFGKSSMA